MSSPLKSLGRLMACAVILFVGLPATAAEFYKKCEEVWSGTVPPPQVCSLELRGGIRPGDATKLIRILTDPEHLDVYNSGFLKLNSPGGDVLEALSLVKVLKLWMAEVEVEKHAICASACFLVWIGTPIHHASDASQKEVTTIGLHRPYFSKAAYLSKDVRSVESAQVEAMDLVKRYLARHNLPQYLVDAMLSRASNDIYFLTPTDIERVGPHAPYMEEIVIAECGTSWRKVRRDMKIQMDQSTSSSRASDAVQTWLAFLGCVQRTAKTRRLPPLVSSFEIPQ